MGDEWVIERRLGPVVRLPRLRRIKRSSLNPGDAISGVDDLGALLIVPVLIVFLLLLLLLAPLILLVLEAALLLLVVAPVLLLALVVGIRRHELVARNTRTGEVVHRPVRGLLASMRLKRRWRAEIARSGRPEPAAGMS